MIKFRATTFWLALVVALLGLGSNSRAQTYTAQPLPSSGLLTQNPFVFTGLIFAQRDLSSSSGYWGSGAVVKNPRVVFSCAHVVFDDSALSGAIDPWLSTVRWNRAWFSGAPPASSQGQLLRGYIYYVSYANAAAKSGSSLSAFDLDFVVHYSYENTALGGFAGWWDDGLSNLNSSKTKLITGYPSGIYSASDVRKFLMHYSGPFVRPYTLQLGNYLTVTEVSAGPGNSGGPVWVSDGTDYFFAGVHVSGQVRSLGQTTDLAGVYGIDTSSVGLIDAAINAGGGSVSAPVITSQPTSRRVNVGQFASFSVGVTGQSLTYRWLKNGVTISGASTGFYSIAGAALSDAGNYQVIVSNAGGEARSAVVTLSVDAPPVINNPPMSSTVTEGQAAQLTVSATGSGILSYRWYQGQSGNTSTPVAGATSASLTTPPLTATTSFWVRVTDGGGLSSDSPTATITVTPSPPRILTQPASVAVQEGQNVSFSVAAQGSGYIRYQWYWDGLPILAAESPSYSIDGIRRVNEGRYSVSVSNDGGSVTSSAAELTVNYPPAIAVQPTLGGPLFVGASATFSVTASAMPAPTYQWRKGGALIAGGTNSSYEIPSVGLADAGSYDVIVQNGLGSTRSLVVKLVVNQVPTITEQPVSQASAVGGSLSLRVTALGAPQLQYQWRKDGVVMPSATSSSLVFDNVQASAAGRYQVTVSNALGSVTSSLATVTVTGISAPAVTPEIYRYVVDDGGSAIIKAIPTGATMLQWRRNGRPIQGATAAQLELTAAKPLKDNGWYQLVASNEAGATVSKPVFVAVAGGYRVHAWGDPAVINVPAGLDDIVGISAGAFHSIAIKRDGSLVSWGSSGSEISGVVPTGLGKVVSVAAGSGFNVALIEDGSLISWGKSEVLGVPSDPNGFVAVAAGDSHALAIRSDGSVAAWGYNNKGQTTVPTGLQEVTSIAAGSYFSIASRADGTVVMWPSYPTSSSLAVPAGLTGVSSVSASFSQALVLRGGGTCQGWGSLGGNTLGGTRNTQYLSGLNGLVSIAAGELFGLFLYADGRVYATGYGVGQSVVPSQLGGVIAIAAGKNHSLALSPYRKPSITKHPQTIISALGASATFSVEAEGGGTALTFQWRKDGQVISGATQKLYTVASVGASSAGSYDVLVSNYIGSAASAGAVLTVVPSSGAAVQAGPSSVSVNSGQSASFSVVASGSPTPDYQWLKDGVAIPGATNPSLVFNSVIAADAGSYSVEVRNIISGTVSKQTSLSAELAVTTIAPRITSSPISGTAIIGRPVEFSVTATGSALSYQWYRDGMLIPGATSSSFTLGSVNLSDSGSYVAEVANEAVRVRSVSVGYNHAMFLMVDGTLWAVGANEYGQLGDGSTTGREVPVKVSSNVKSVSAGSEHTFFIKADGSLWSMGKAGRVGLSGSLNRTSPVQVATGVVSVSAALWHTMFIKADGTLWATGSNDSGQMGIGGIGAASTPQYVTSGVASVSSLRYHTLFVKNDGSLWGMGSNFDGELGDGTASLRSTPVRVASDVVRVSAGTNHTMFIKNDGSLWGMGFNREGQLGVKTSGFSQLTPIQVATGVVEVACGRGSFFKKSDASIWAMGANNYGELGHGVLNTKRYEPLRIATGVESFSAGNATTFFIRSDGSLWGCGLNSSGQIGDGSKTDRRLPVRVVGGPLVSAAATLSVVEAAPPAIQTSPISQALSLSGGSVTFSIEVNSPLPVTYQWLKNGSLISGATNATYTVLSAQLDSVGKYSVVVANSSGSVTSSPASLEIKKPESSASHSVPGGAYVPGQILLVTNSLSFSGSNTAIRWSVLLPSGWTLASHSADTVVSGPSMGQADLLEWVWSPTASSGELTFAYLLAVPQSENGGRELASLISVSSPDAQRFLARPDPLRLSQVLAHSADTDRNGKLSLLELTRVIELYNTRSGTTRSGCYSLANSVSEDGFASAPERTPGSSVSLARVHSADSNRDGKISLTELTRVIELYNTRNGTTRTGAYKMQTGTEDGFAPSP